jgi:biopolymer transport protein TolQ
MPASTTTGLAFSLGLVSKLVLLVLIGFSVVAWAIVFVKWRAFRTADADEQRFLHTYGKSAESHDLAKHAKRAPHSPSAAIYLGLTERLAREGGQTELSGFSARSLEEPDEAPVPDRRYLEQVAAKILQSHVSRLEDWLPFLATTGNVTPFIGLLGTVMGIIDAFQEIGRQGTASLAAVAPGVAEALVATAAGLFTAIPAVIAYNYFLMRIRKIAFRTDSFVVEFVQSLRSRPRQVGVRG